MEKTGKKYIAYIDRIKDEKIPLDMRYERLADEEDIVIPIDNESLAKLEDGFSTARHEISTVMTSILGYSQLLSRRDNPKYRDNIVANLAVFSQLYTELPIMFLDSVKIENISIKNLQELISENIKSVSPSIIPNVDFGDIEFETGDVRWAPIYIRRLAANIMQNADREGATEMDVTAEILPADAVNNIPRRFAVHFTDNGTHGIDDTILRYGFQKNTSKHLSGVLGDGNAMAGLNDRLTMINEHGGISIAKRPDGKSGARVTATFPL